MSLFSGLTAGDLADLWRSQNYVVQSHAQGWECPKCGRVYSPVMVMCSYCVPPKVTTVTMAVDINTTQTPFENIQG